MKRSVGVTLRLNSAISKFLPTAVILLFECTPRLYTRTRFIPSLMFTVSSNFLTKFLIVRLAERLS